MASRIRPELQARFGNDPDALEWARGHVQVQLDWLKEASELPQASPEFVRLAKWCADFMRDGLIGNRLTCGAFDESFGTKPSSLIQLATRAEPGPEKMTERHQRDHHGEPGIAQLGCPLCAEELATRFDLPEQLVVRAMARVRDEGNADA
jgi:hypothetical protein